MQTRTLVSYSTKKNETSKPPQNDLPRTRQIAMIDTSVDVWLNSLKILVPQKFVDAEQSVKQTTPYFGNILHELTHSSQFL